MQNGPAKQGAGPAPFGGGGEMGERLRAFDWKRSPLGAVEDWPASLRTMVAVMLGNRHPMAVWWGRDCLHLYNDAYRPILGDKHPAALGRSGMAVWRESWQIIGPMARGVLDGGPATWNEHFLFPVNRSGFLEETYFTFSYSPIPADNGTVGGVLVTTKETTIEVQDGRQIRTLRDLAARATLAKTTQEALESAARILSTNDADFPFALLYAVEENGTRARLVDTVGMEGYEGPGMPPSVPLDDDAAHRLWPFAAAGTATGPVIVSNLQQKLGPMPGGRWKQSPEDAIVLCLTRPGLAWPYGFLVCGASPRRRLDERYLGFVRLTADSIVAAIANARAYEEERKRAEALAEIDRAKTTFFSNISHELRTPLALMLGSVEETLADPVTPVALKERLEVSQRNSLRLLKLVNSLLDFSRIEAGRLQAYYQPTDLSGLTAELASMFRSVVERAGMNLTVDCPTLAEPVYVDRDMWEKIVLNLLANAFKYTLAGEIEVTLRESGGQKATSGEEEGDARQAVAAGEDCRSTHPSSLTSRHVILSVRDTGLGIPEHELANIMQRFYRVAGSRGRTHEGSGIGLSLVQELVKLHGGSIGVESVYGQGSTFAVRIPLGNAHLPAEKLRRSEPFAPSRGGGNAYVQEALRWLPGPAYQGEEQWVGAATFPDVEAHTSEDERIIIADDNADMRDYLQRLLAPYYRVETVPDGEAVLAAARRERPDLMVVDVMMPGMDGFALLQAIRRDENLKTLPVIMLSARAGEESRVEGLEAGADDYLTKPFSARELLARVGAQLGMARVRRAAQRTLRESEERHRRLLTLLPIAVYTCEAPAGTITFYNEHAAELWGRAPSIGSTDVRFCGSFKLFRPDGTPLPHDKAPMAEALRTGAAFRNVEVVIERPDGTRITVLVNIDPVLDPDGRVVGAVNAFIDTTALSRAEAGIRQRTAQFETLLKQAPLGVYLVDAAFRIREVNPTALPVFGDIPNLIGRDFEEVIRMLWPKAYADEVIERFRHTLNSGEPCIIPERAETRIDRGVTEYYEWQIHRIPLPEGGYGVVCYFRDISAQVRARRRIAESEERYRGIVNQSIGGIAETDETGRFTTVNNRYCDIVGYSREELLQLRMQDITHPDDLAQNLALVAKLAAEGQPFEIEKRYIRNDGSLVWVHNSVSGIHDVSGNLRSLIAVCIDITERKKTEDALRESEGRFRAVVSQTSVGITRADASGKLVFVNQKFCEMLNSEESELIGKSIWEITFPADLPANRQLFEKMVATGAPFEIEKRLIRRDGTLIWVNVSVAPIKDESGKPQSTVAVAIDITGRREAEAALRESEEKYRSLFESIDEGFALIEILFDEAGRPADYRFLETNAVFEQQTGLKQARGKNARQLVPDLEQWWIDTYGKVALTGESTRFEHSSEPMRRWFDVYAARVGGDRSRRVAIVFNDISERKRAEQSLREADRRKDEFMAMLGHELRNPLGIIGNAVQLLRRLGGPEAQFADVREMIERQVIHTSRMLDDLLDVSRISRGKVQLNKQPWELRDIVRQTVEDYRNSIDENGLTLELKMTEQPLRIIGDRTRLAQAFGNLLHNACKFTDRGGSVWINLQGDIQGEAIVRVMDDGIGMEPEALGWVFEPFSQADRTLDRSRGGLGLGLSLVKGIVELHGGHVTASSAGPGRGAEFTIRLPLNPSLPNPAEGSPVESGPGRSRRILIIEDNPVAARSTRLLLEYMGHTCEVAHNGADGIEAARRFRPEIVLCDIGLPQLNGYQVAQALREERELGGCLLIAVSGYAHDEQRAGETGFDLHLLKPIDFTVLKRMLAESQG